MNDSRDALTFVKNWGHVSLLQPDTVVGLLKHIVVYLASLVAWTFIAGILGGTLSAADPIAGSVLATILLLSAYLGYPAWILMGRSQARDMSPTKDRAEVVRAKEAEKQALGRSLARYMLTVLHAGFFGLLLMKPSISVVRDDVPSAPDGVQAPTSPGPAQPMRPIEMGGLRIRSARNSQPSPSPAGSPYSIPSGQVSSSTPLSLPTRPPVSVPNTPQTPSNTESRAEAMVRIRQLESRFTSW